MTSDIAQISQTNLPRKPRTNKNHLIMVKAQELVANLMKIRTQYQNKGTVP